MKKYILQREQHLDCELETAWHFFSSPQNLSKITPKDMGFTVQSKNLDEEIYAGMIIDYTVSPIFHIPLKWKTKITQVSKFKSFTDFQEKGPYKYWNHFHEFIPSKTGVLMRDTVNYEMPLGFVGNIAHQVFVKSKLEAIFDYRYKILDKMFNTNK